MYDDEAEEEEQRANAQEQITYSNADDDSDNGNEDIDATLREMNGEEEIKHGITGPAPISHEEKEVHVSAQEGKKREARSPWADGKTYPGTSKNEPCPCGSERKYKMCHGHNEE